MMKTKPKYKLLLLSFILILLNHITLSQCFDPISPFAYSIGPTSGYVNWTTGGASNWQIEYDTTGHILGTGTILDVSSKPFRLTNLQPETSYQYYVRDDCGGSVYSNWVGPYTFATTVLFTNMSVGLLGEYYSSAFWADLNNADGIDVIISGTQNRIKVYRNIAGSFTQMNTIMDDVPNKTIDIGDYDNDGDIDVVSTFSSSYDTKIYRNDGGFVFTDISADLVDVDDGTVAWGDYDNDGDLDLLISGMNSDSEPLGKLYRNDGSDSFTETAIYITPSTWLGKARWADFNNDDYLDILQVGKDFDGNSVSEIYLNTGNDSFVSNESNFVGVFRANTDIGDYDNDGDLDVITSGQWNPVSIYQNNNTVFSNIGITPSVNINYTAMDWGDYDNDGDLDIVMSGRILGANDIIFKFFRNDGDNNFTEIEHTNLLSINFGCFNWADYDNDGDLDILLAGYDGSSYYTRVYRNNILVSNTTPSIPTNLESVTIYDGAKLSWDPSSDSESTSTGIHYNVWIGTGPTTHDILSPMADITSGLRLTNNLGNAMSDTSYYIKGLPIGTYYWSVQAIDNSSNPSDFASVQSFEILPMFTELDPGFYDLSSTHSTWGDVDNDNDLDLLICGDTLSDDFVTKLFINQSDHSFDSLNFNFTGVEYGSADFGDYDNDGDLDIILAGATAPYGVFNAISEIYRNEGGSTFTSIPNSIPGLHHSAVKWGDYDNDGDLDIAIAGENDSYQNFTKIFRNDGGDTFVDINAGLLGIEFGNIKWADFDNDLDLDLLICGGSRLRIYENSGNDVFTQSAFDYSSSNESQIDLTDYDNDNDIDILITGTLDYLNSAKIFENLGNFNFTLSNAIIRGVSESTNCAGDFNNDGYSDIFYTGRSSSFITKLYFNNHDKTYTDTKFLFDADYRGVVNCADYDNDSDLDALVMMYGDYPRLYKNNMNYPNDKPLPPNNLSSEIVGYGIEFNWDNTDSAGISYNIRVGTTPGGYDIICPMSNLSTGYVKIPQMGNCQTNTGWKLDSLLEGTYYWSVQAIDQSFLGGDWTSEEIFIITVVRANFESDTVCVGDSTHFTDISLTGGSGMTDWEWDFGDGNFSIEQNPEHLYASAGNYDVRLIAHENEYNDTTLITVVVKERPTADFTADIACQGTPTSFTNNTTDNGLTIIDWYWDFDDGIYSFIQHPGTHGFINSGDYLVKLRATADNGCSDLRENTVSVSTYPIAAITSNAPLSFCDGDNTTLSVDYNQNFSYQWKIDDANITDADSSKFVAMLSGDYTVEVVNSLGNCMTTSNITTVIAAESPIKPILNTAGYDPTDCPQENIIILAVDQPTIQYTYQWKRNGVDLDGEIETTLEDYLNEGDYSIVASKNACSNESDIVGIYYNDDLPDKPQIIATGSEVWYLACSNENALEYEWYFNDEQIPGADEYLYVADNDLGIYVVKIATENGCFIASDAVTIPLIATGIGDENPFSNIMIYPNPTPGVFTIEMDNQVFGELITRIFTQNAIEILNIKFDKSSSHFKAQIDLSGQGKGVYIISFTIDKYKTEKKLIIE